MKISAIDRYFIALIPPEPLFTQIHQLKIYCSEAFGSKAALRSPPHLTLHMPFEWTSKKTGMTYGKRLLTEWNSCRIVRSVAGISFFIYGIQLHEWPVIFFGLAWLEAGLFSSGCCAGSSWYNPANSRSLPGIKSIDFEEIK